jgi:hypothetical protein
MDASVYHSFSVLHLKQQSVGIELTPKLPK